MKIYFSSYHSYPGNLYGVASHSVHDNLVKGLAELGHDVWYHLKDKPETELPPGVKYTSTWKNDVDIWHINDGDLKDAPKTDIPWVKILHCDIRIKGLPLNLSRKNWIYVSETLAELYQSRRFVHNGIDPSNFIYSETKDNYLFFLVGGVNRAHMKGIDIALSVAQKAGMKLKVAGTSTDEDQLLEFKNMCERSGAHFVGSVHGLEKAELFAGARALLFPSRFNEACPLVVLEALMSGTPVIASNNGALPELINSKVGMLCAEEDDYLLAIDRIDELKAEDCRKYALDNFHYSKMASAYVEQYKEELVKRNSRILIKS